MPSRWKTSGLSGSRRARRRARASAMGCEMGRIRPTSVFERRREPDDTTGHVNLLPGEAEDLLLAPAGVVGEIEDVLPRGGQVGADGEVFGVLEEALAGRILAEAVGEAGHGVEPAPVDGERAHAVEGRGLPVDRASGRPGGAPGRVGTGGSGSVVNVAARAARPKKAVRWAVSAAGGAVGPELPDLVVLEVGVAEISQGRSLAYGARKRPRRVNPRDNVGDGRV